jgi:hypothetical protein
MQDHLAITVFKPERIEAPLAIRDTDAPYQRVGERIPFHLDLCPWMEGIATIEIQSDEPNTVHFYRWHELGCWDELDSLVVSCDLATMPLTSFAFSADVPCLAQAVLKVYHHDGGEKVLAGSRTLEMMQYDMKISVPPLMSEYRELLPWFEALQNGDDPPDEPNFPVVTATLLPPSGPLISRARGDISATLVQGGIGYTKGYQNGSFQFDDVSLPADPLSPVSQKTLDTICFSVGKVLPGEILSSMDWSKLVGVNLADFWADIVIDVGGFLIQDEIGLSFFAGEAEIGLLFQQDNFRPQYPLEPEHLSYDVQVILKENDPRTQADSLTCIIATYQGDVLATSPPGFAPARIFVDVYRDRPASDPRYKVYRSKGTGITPPPGTKTRGIVLHVGPVKPYSDGSHIESWAIPLYAGVSDEDTTIYTCRVEKVVIKDEVIRRGLHEY